VDVTSSEVTAKVFEHWGFDSEFITIIKYADNPSAAPKGLREYCMALNIVKTIVSINKPFAEVSINFGLKKASDAGLNYLSLEDTINEMLEAVNQGEK
jgi:HD-like signal output (HDOD) protein